MKCVECRQRKGKRNCPALNRFICAQCCGEKRVIEIDCPPDCQYLAAGQSYQWMKKYSALLQEETDPGKKRRLYSTVSEFHPLLAEIEREIVQYANDLSSFDDEHTLQVIRQLKSTYQTEEKGVIFEETSSNPIVQNLYRRLREALENRREDLSKKGYNLRTEALLNCLEVLSSDIQYHIRKSEAKNDYLQFIKRNHPGIAKTQSKSIIVPGR